MSALRHGLGGLISWNGINFLRGRSTAMPGPGIVAATTHSLSTGPLKIDRLGNTVAPIDYVVVYEYLFFADPTMSFTLADAQTKFDQLVNLMNTSPVGTLVTFGLGNYADHISGIARLESLVITNAEANFKIADLTFFCEAGMT